MKQQTMPILAAAFAASLSLGALALPASAAVTVSFIQPENFRDLPFSPSDRAQVLKELGEHFAKLEKSLPAGQDLKVDVIDLDMAGRMVPNFRGNQDLRVLHGGADWPHMTVRYILTANGQVLSSGEDQLSDMAYLDRINIYSDGDPLRYEKRMVDDWFKKKFAADRRR
ncbi:MAG: hypothetical protein JWP59_3115 [Massilia sp.]|nr:hypothetical protein [Massilia sp.]